MLNITITTGALYAFSYYTKPIYVNRHEHATPHFGKKQPPPQKKKKKKKKNENTGKRDR